MIPAFCLRLWPSLRNPAWRQGNAAAAVLGAALAVSVSPLAVRRKLDASAMAPLKNRFMVDNLGGLPSTDITSLYTYQDMSEAQRCGEDVAATRVFRWLVASQEAGRPVNARGQVIDSVARAEAYCRNNLDLFRSLQENGYNYNGPDEICLGIAADGEIIHMRRGTHRIAAARLLGLPAITGRVTHLDRAFAARATGDGKDGAGVIEALAQAIQNVTRQTIA